MPLGRAIAIALALVVLCIAYIPMRGERGDLVLHGDALFYADMVRGGVDVEAPFRYRVVVPLLARALPWSPAAAIRALSWLSLLATYTLVLRIAERLAIAPLGALMGLLLAIFTGTHLYNYENPFITDAAGTLAITLCMYALVSQRYALFVCVSALGIGVREACVFVAPAWAGTRQWLRAAASLALTLALYFGLRAWVGPSQKTLDEGPFAIFPARPVRELITDAFSAWHALWLLAPLGLAAITVQQKPLVWLSICLVSGSVFTSLLATDTSRMFQPLFPLMAIGVARFLELAWSGSRASRRTSAALCIACVGSSWVWQPVRFLSLVSKDPIYRPAQAIALGCLLLLGYLTARSAWKSRAQPLAVGQALPAGPTDA